MKYTKKQVIKELRDEYKNLSEKEWSVCGDVNMEDHGGVEYRKDSAGNIEATLYHGLSNIEEGEEGVSNTKYGTFDLDDLIADIDEIWGFSDVENCGLSIGWLLQSLDQYQGVFT
jgi:hypothetical protein